jgi:hypothetical protein
MASNNLPRDRALACEDLPCASIFNLPISILSLYEKRYKINEQILSMSYSGETNERVTLWSCLGYILSS